MDHQADRRVNVTFKSPAELRMVSSSGAGVTIENADCLHSFVTVPAAGFVVMTF